MGFEPLTQFDLAASPDSPFSMMPSANCFRTRALPTRATFKASAVSNAWKIHVRRRRHELNQKVDISLTIGPLRLGVAVWALVAPLGPRSGSADATGSGSGKADCSACCVQEWET
jgi:hypothetical protein